MSSDFVDRLRKLPGASVSFSAGDTLFRQRDAIRFAFLIEEGSVHLVRYSGDGKALVMQRASVGMLLAESSLFSDHYHCDATAIAPVTTYRIRKSAIRRAMIDQPDLSFAFAAYLAREVQRMRARSEILALKTVRDRLNAWMSLNGPSLPPRGNWRVIAEDIGVSPEAFYRELARRPSINSTSRIERPRLPRPSG